MKNVLVLLLLLSVSACSSTHREASLPVAPVHDEAQMNNLAIYAMSLYDTPYQSGGASRLSGFDCSGFVQYVFKNTLGLQLPRTSLEMSRMGMPLNTAQLQPGDLVFFNTARSPYSHVGIFIGKNRFIHAPSSGKAITLANLNSSYWHTHYEGARRITIEQLISNN